jgi:hypothetical protein
VWIFEQLSGRLLKQGGGLLAIGYSGAGKGKNSPTEENIQNFGPIPEGFYDVQPPINSPIHGPFALPLLPDAGNCMFGRCGFMIHGDSLERPGEASEGCIVIARFAREMLYNGGDHRLQVVRQMLVTTNSMGQREGQEG